MRELSARTQLEIARGKVLVEHAERDKMLHTWVSEKKVIVSARSDGTLMYSVGDTFFIDADPRLADFPSVDLMAKLYMAVTFGLEKP